MIFIRGIESRQCSTESRYEKWWKPREKTEMKNVILNKISIILEFVQYHYVAIFLFSIARAVAPLAPYLSANLDAVMPKLLQWFIDPSSLVFNHLLALISFFLRFRTFYFLFRFLLLNNIQLYPRRRHRFAVVAHSVESRNFEFSSRKHF